MTLNDENAQNQCRLIAEYLQQGNALTSALAMRKFGIMRLASRVYDLRKKGIEVKKEMEVSRNRYGKTIRFAKYSIA